MLYNKIISMASVAFNNFLQHCLISLYFVDFCECLAVTANSIKTIYSWHTYSKMVKIPDQTSLFPTSFQKDIM